MSDVVDLSLLERALTRLGEAFATHLSRPSDEFVRDSIIKRFEFTYELAHATLRRYLEEASNAGEEVDRMSFPAMIRTASEHGLLLNGWDVWEDFRKARNKTSHTYNEETAMQVVEKVPNFVTEVRHLLNELKERPL